MTFDGGETLENKREEKKKKMKKKKIQKRNRLRREIIIEERGITATGVISEFPDLFLHKFCTCSREVSFFLCIATTMNLYLMMITLLSLSLSFFLPSGHLLAISFLSIEDNGSILRVCVCLSFCCMCVFLHHATWGEEKNRSRCRAKYRQPMTQLRERDR